MQEKQVQYFTSSKWPYIDSSYNYFLTDTLITPSLNLIYKERKDIYIIQESSDVFTSFCPALVMCLGHYP